MQHQSYTVCVKFCSDEEEIQKQYSQEVTMMSRTLDLNHNVQELCTEYPELTGIMADLGFKDIT